EHLQHQHVPVGNLTPVGVLPHGTLPRWSGDGRRRRSWPMVVLVLFLLSTLALAAYLVFAWWLPRNADSGRSEIAGFPMVESSESSSLAISPLAPEQPTTSVDASQPASDSGMSPVAGSPAVPGAGVAGSPAQGGVAGAQNPAGIGTGAVATLPPGAPAAGVPAASGAAAA